MSHTYSGNGGIEIYSQSKSCCAPENTRIQKCECTILQKVEIYICLSHETVHSFTLYDKLSSTNMASLIIHSIRILRTTSKTLDLNTD